MGALTKTQPPCIDCGTLAGFSSGQRIPWRIHGRCHACDKRWRRLNGRQPEGNRRGRCDGCAAWARLLTVEGVALCKGCRANPKEKQS